MTDSLNLVKHIVECLEEKKALDIVTLHISKLTIIADYFIIASGRSELQVNSLYDELERKMSELGYEPLRRDGHKGGRWIVLDYGDVIVHIFHKEERAFYNLERLWSDAERI